MGEVSPAVPDAGREDSRRAQSELSEGKPLKFGGTDVVELPEDQVGAERDLAPESAPDQDATIQGGSALATGKSTKSPAFQFYPSDFIGSSKVQRMPLAERGAYITLLSFAWLDHGLPTDMGELGRMVGLTRAAFTKMWNSQLHKCFVERSGKFVNLRQEDIRKAQAEYRKRQRDNAAKGWQSRGTAVASERHMPDACSPSPSPTPSLSPTPSFAKSVRPAGVSAGTNPRDHLNHAWCGITFRICVPERLHGDLVRKLGGEDAPVRIVAFYESVEAALADGPVPADIFKFWRERYDQQFGLSAVPKSSSREPQWVIDARAEAAKGAA